MNLALMSSGDSDPAMKVREVAHYFNCHVSTVYQAISDRQLPAFRIANGIRVRYSAVIAFEKRRSTGPEQIEEE
jgi:excisionase family DNA binding protein